MAMDDARKAAMREGVATLMDRVEGVLQMTPEARHEKITQVLRKLPPPVRDSILQFAGALAFGATGCMTQYPAMKTALDGIADTEGKAYVGVMSEVMALVILTCTHGIALEVDAEQIKALEAFGDTGRTPTRGTTFHVTGGGDDVGVPIGQKWDGGPDGKGH